MQQKIRGLYCPKCGSDKTIFKLSYGNKHAGLIDKNQFACKKRGCGYYSSRTLIRYNTLKTVEICPDCHEEFIEESIFSIYNHNDKLEKHYSFHDEHECKWRQP